MFDYDDLDDARADALADARADEAYERLADYHADREDECPGDEAGDDDCTCADAIASDYRLDPIER